MCVCIRVPKEYETLRDISGSCMSFWTKEKKEEGRGLGLQKESKRFTDRHERANMW